MCTELSRCRESSAAPQSPAAIGAVLGWESASARSAPARNDLAPSREDDRVHGTRVTPSVSETTSKVPRGTLYRGREGMWSWVLHRITGVAIFFFLLVHVLDTALDPGLARGVQRRHRHLQEPDHGRSARSVLVAAIVYHAYNGLRIIAVDLWPWATRHQRQLWWGVLGLWAVTMAGFAPRHLMHRLRRRHDDRHDRGSPLPAHRPSAVAGPQPREVGLDLHARLGRPARGPDLRPPVRQPHGGRRHLRRSTSPSSPASSPRRSGSGGTC